MALIVGVNSWVTVEEADDYLEDFPGTANWFVLAETPATPGAEAKSSYLVLAFRYLINNSSIITISKDSTDDNVLNAQIEMVLFLLNNKEEYERHDAMIAAGIKDFNMSKWAEALGEITLPSKVSALLSNYLISGGGVAQLLGDDYLD